MRDNTARPVTVTSGTNVLVGQDRKELPSELTRILEGKAKTGTIPRYGMDAGDRIADVLCFDRSR